MKNLMHLLMLSLFAEPAHLQQLKRSTRQLSDHELADQRKATAEAHGLRQFEVDGIKVMALNHKNAVRKAAKQKQVA